MSEDIDIQTQKKQLRAHALETRARITSSIDLEDALIPHILPLRSSWQGVVLAGYMPIRNELSPFSVMDAASKLGATLALPRVLSKTEMDFRQFDTQTQLVSGFAGIAQPDDSAAIIIPDIILAPLLAFDRKGTRLGYGAGHYDRYIGQLRAQNPDLLVIGVAYGEQMCLFPLPYDMYDQKLDMVVTPQQLFDFRP